MTRCEFVDALRRRAVVLVSLSGADHFGGAWEDDRSMLGGPGRVVRRRSTLSTWPHAQDRPHQDRPQRWSKPPPAIASFLRMPKKEGPRIAPRASICSWVWQTGKDSVSRPLPPSLGFCAAGPVLCNQAQHSNLLNIIERAAAGKDLLKWFRWSRWFHLLHWFRCYRCYR